MLSFHLRWVDPLGIIGVYFQLNRMQQAKDYYNIARIAMEADNSNELIVLGLTDAMTWRGGRNPLLYDSDLTPKPAYYGLHQELRETSSTPTRITNHGLYKKKSQEGYIYCEACLYR